MSLVLNTNIDSIVAQNNLNGSQSLLSQSLTRLSSGLRINSAADDAAGLAISQQFTHSDQWHQPGHQQREQRGVRNADRRRRVQHHRQQPAEHPHPRGGSGQRLEQRLGPPSSRPAGAAADLGNHPDRAADLLQRPASAERLKRRARLTRSARTSATPSRSTSPRASARTRSARLLRPPRPLRAWPPPAH